MRKLKSIMTLLALLSVGTLNASDGASLYAKCSACHGKKGETKAMGVSKVINTMSEADIKMALNGYKSGGTFGHSPMKAAMQGQAKTLSDAQIDELSKYIPTLK